MEGFKSKLKDFIKSEKFFYFICCLLFAISFTGKKEFSDDAIMVKSYNENNITNIVDIFLDELSRYSSWSSRTLVNTVAGYMIIMPKVVWQISMGLAMYILMNSLSVIFKIKSKTGALFICFLSMLIPWEIYCTAGWIAASATYFITVAVGVAGFIPIAKIYRNEKVNAVECILCTLALIYVSNIEQGMAVALGIYLIANIYFIAVKKLKPILVTQLLICIISALYIFLCPGNQERTLNEIRRCFSSYPMLDKIDKADIGLFSTLNSLFISNINLLILAISLLITYIGIKKYNQAVYRTIFILPSAVLLLLGPLYDSLTVHLFPFFKTETMIVSQEGIVTPSTVNSISTFFSIFVMLGLLLLILLCVILISNDLIQMISSIVILGAGLMSRVALGFSPTNAYSTRTFSVLYICMITFAVKIYSENLEAENQELTGRKLSVYNVCLSTVIILCFINLIFIP